MTQLPILCVLCERQRPETFFNELKKNLIPLIAADLTTVNARQRIHVSTNVKISPHAERTLSQFVIV